MKNHEKPMTCGNIDTLLAANGAAHHAQISKIVDEHIKWALQLAHTALAPAETRRALPKTRAFTSWYRSATQQLPNEQPLIDRLAVLHDQLHKATAHAIAKAGNAPVDGTTYEYICTCFSNFIEPLREFEKSFIAAVHGIDTHTGLRSRYSVMGDLAAEQKRLARSGMPMTVVLVSLDQYDEIATLHGAETRDKLLATVAECILTTIRAYDGAYRLGGDTFLLCLKRSDLAAAKAAITRLQDCMSKATVRLLGGGALSFSASFAMVAMTPESDIVAMLYELEKKLATRDGSTGGGVIP